MSKPLRIFVAGLVHETTTFSPVPTARASFDEYYRPAGGAYAPPPGVNLLGYGQFVDLARGAGHVVIPSTYACAWPSAPVNAVDYAGLKGEILEDLRRALPVDVVFLFMHGAQMAEGCDDVEGDVLAAVRECAGSRAAIGIELDLHGNVTRRMVETADLVLGCLEYPHTDYAERTAIAFDVLTRAARGDCHPRTVAMRVPLVGIYPTTMEPMTSLMARVRARQAEPGVLAVSTFHGFQLADTAFTGGSVIVVTERDPALAERMAREIAADFLATVRTVRLGLPMEAALDEALAGDDGPVVLGDRADNAGGGAASDSTYVLRALLERRVRNAALALMWDPVAVEFAHLAGVGRRLKLRLGGKAGPMSGQPLDVEAEVLALRHDAAQALFAQGEPTLALGRSAALRIDGVDVVVNSSRQQVFDPRVFTAHGVDPRSKRLVVVKSTSHFVNGFAPLATRIVFGDAPGTVAFDLRQLPFTKLPRPLYPLDEQGLEITELGRREGAVDSTGTP
jgi:microcystin degradation protein MlrC